MVAMKVNAFVASLDPSDANRDIGAFLHEAGNALNLSSDADLARAMLVSPATFASWKRREKLPDDKIKWFQTVFPAMVFDRWRSSIPPYGTAVVEYVLPAINYYYGDRINDPDCLREIATVFGGLVAFVPLLAHTHLDSAKDEAVDIPAHAIVDALAGALTWRAERGF